ncbi:MAG: aminotransferase class V-fold PLP-dependent enzyme [Deltaproteobacteria bacterium]|nr:aminotransferase class V-fold PLP-dependent enzyme [Deltaproteobacteria bacterium]
MAIFSATTGGALGREQFPVIGACVYFDHAGVAPVSRRVADAVATFVADARDFARLHYPAWEARAEAVRAGAARLIGASPEEVAFVASTSDGLSSIATALDWRAGDSVVAVDGEFPANVYPWWALRRLGVETRLAPTVDGRLTVEAVAALVDGTTRIVSVSAVDFATGHRRPLAAIAELCRRRGVLFCVDAIQALGAVRIDVERDGIDALSADGHKWLCAPEGCGLLYVSRRWLDRLVPQRIGWKSVVDASRYLPYHFELKADAQKFECGSSNFLAIHALGAAIDLMLELGVDAIERRVLAVTTTLRAALVGRGFRLVSPDGAHECAGITTIGVGDTPEAVVRKLRAAGVLASPRGGGVRFSPHVYCDDDDIARCLEALGAAR